MKHKHCEMIKAWADGAKIQYKIRDDEWEDVSDTFVWHKNSEYRIKPEPVTLYVNEYKNTGFKYSKAFEDYVDAVRAGEVNMNYIRTIKLMEVEENE